MGWTPVWSLEHSLRGQTGMSPVVDRSVTIYDGGHKDWEPAVWGWASLSRTDQSWSTPGSWGKPLEPVPTKRSRMSACAGCLTQTVSCNRNTAEVSGATENGGVSTRPIQQTGRNRVQQAGQRVAVLPTAKYSDSSGTGNDDVSGTGNYNDKPQSGRYQRHPKSAVACHTSRTYR